MPIENIYIYIYKSTAELDRIVGVYFLYLHAAGVSEEKVGKNY